MVVVYRLQGLDGEATEDRVDELTTGDQGDDQEDNETIFAVTDIIGTPFPMLLNTHTHRVTK